MFVTFDVTHEPMSWSNKDADSNIALMSTTLLVSQPEISALKSGYWEKACDMFVTRLVSQLGMGPYSLELHIPSCCVSSNFVANRHNRIARRILSSVMGIAGGEGGGGGEGGRLRVTHSSLHKHHEMGPSAMFGHQYFL